jgi:hypothetical protein
VRRCGSKQAIAHACMHTSKQATKQQATNECSDKCARLCACVNHIQLPLPRYACANWVLTVGAEINKCQVLHDRHNLIKPGQTNKAASMCWRPTHESSTTARARRCAMHGCGVRKGTCPAYTANNTRMHTLHANRCTCS